MSPAPRSKLKLTEEEIDRRLRTRLDLLIALMIVQIFISIGIWVDRHQSSDQPTETATQSEAAITEDESIPTETVISETIEPAETVEEPEDTVTSVVLDAPIRVQVLNGCGVKRIAARTKAWLIRNRYDVRDVGNADRSDYEHCRILDRSGNLTAARELARILSIDESQIARMNEVSSPRFDLTLVIGEDYKRMPIGQ